MASSAPIELTAPPKTNDVYMWADYIELLCLVNPDRVYSKADIIDRFSESLDLDEELVRIDKEGEVTPLRPTERNDKRANQAYDWYAHLLYREATFGDSYPFYLSSNGDTLHRYPELTAKHKVYIFFLLAANLRYLQEHHPITSSFEIVSLEALKNYLPNQALVYPFGKGSSSGARYTGRLFDKIKRLAEDLGERLNCDESNFKPTNSGDGGLDIVAWLPFDGDPSTGFVIVFAQCACTADWDVKQLSSSRVRWSRYIVFSVPPTNICFIPICFRSSTGSWDNPTDILETILIDRVRLIRLLKHSYDKLVDGVIPLPLVQRIIDYEEPLV